MTRGVICDILCRTDPAKAMKGGRGEEHVGKHAEIVFDKGRLVQAKLDDGTILKPHQFWWKPE